MKKVILVSNGNDVYDDLIYHRYATYLYKEDYDVTVIGIKSRRLPKEKLNVKVIPLEPAKSRLDRFTRKRREIEQLCLKCADKDTTFFLFTVDLCGLGLKLLKKDSDVVQVFLENYIDKTMDKSWIPMPLRPIVRSTLVHKQVELGKACGRNIFVDHITMREYKDKLGKAKSVLLPNYPILLTDINITDNAKICFNSPRKLVYVGGLSRDRGLELMIRLAGVLQGKVELHLYGTSSEPDFEKLIKMHENVFYHGFIDYTDLLQRLNEYDLGLFLPLKCRAFLNLAENVTKQFEYMLAGLPIISADVAGLANIIENDSKAGICVNTDDFDECVEQIENFIFSEDKLIAASKNGVIAAKNRFNWESVVSELYEVIDREKR